MSQDADREAWVKALAKEYFREMEGHDAMNVYEVLAEIAAEWAAKLADDHAENWGVARDLPLPWVPESWVPPTKQGKG